MGLAAARGFAENGAAVALLDRNADAVKQAAQSLVDAGHQAIGIACDVTDEAQVAGAVPDRIEHGRRRLQPRRRGSGFAASKHPTMPGGVMRSQMVAYSASGPHSQTVRASRLL